MRSTVSRIGAATPMLAWPGTSPMPRVETIMPPIEISSAVERPRRSPMMPMTIAPSGRAR